MARYKLTLAYDGTAYFGSQRQARRRTVQSELEKAARKLGWRGTAVLLAGRTDAGVHAAGQVAALDLEWRHGPVALRDAFNAQLPEDLAVLAAEGVREAFHPRFDAVSRRYRYGVRCAPVPHPIEDRYVWRVWPPIDPVVLMGVAQVLLGTHAFGAFGSAARRGGSTVRTVSFSRWTANGDILLYDIVADGFLYRMVRRLVFVQVAAGQGRCKVQTISSALERGTKLPGLPAGTAPAAGLQLLEVKY